MEGRSNERNVTHASEGEQSQQAYKLGNKVYYRYRVIILKSSWFLRSVRSKSLRTEEHLKDSDVVLSVSGSVVQAIESAPTSQSSCDNEGEWKIGLRRVLLTDVRQKLKILILIKGG